MFIDELNESFDLVLAKKFENWKADILVVQLSN